MRWAGGALGASVSKTDCTSCVLQYNFASTAYLFPRQIKWCISYQKILEQTYKGTVDTCTIVYHSSLKHCWPLKEPIPPKNKKKKKTGNLTAGAETFNVLSAGLSRNKDKKATEVEQPCTAIPALPSLQSLSLTFHIIKSVLENCHFANK